MKHTTFRSLSIAPSTRGFGFAVLERESLVEWGLKFVNKDRKNPDSVKKVAELMVRYQPDSLVMHDNIGKESRRGQRIRELTEQLIALAQKRNINVVLFSRQKLREGFELDDQGAKHEIAEIIAGRFPKELGNRLPLKRKLWTSEDARMDIFQAVALGVRLNSGSVETPKDGAQK